VWWYSHASHPAGQAKQTQKKSAHGKQLSVSVLRGLGVDGQEEGEAVAPQKPPSRGKTQSRILGEAAPKLKGHSTEGIKAMRAIITADEQTLRLEMAIQMDAFDLFVIFTALLEGDGILCFRV
jgi:hypothetical protein